jgi:hypothetical protein
VVAGDPDQLDQPARVLLRLGVRLLVRRLETDPLPLTGRLVPAVVADLEVPGDDARLDDMEPPRGW